MTVVVSTANVYKLDFLYEILVTFPALGLVLTLSCDLSVSHAPVTASFPPTQ